MDEKSKQLLQPSRPDIGARPGCEGYKARQNYEHRRRGTCNIFVAVEPRGGRRQVDVSVRRTKIDFVHFVQGLPEGVYADVDKLHVVLDNLNTHFARSFEEVLSAFEVGKLLRRIEFHHTPKHVSWLNMAKLEIGIMKRQCTGTRVQGRGDAGGGTGALAARTQRAEARNQLGLQPRRRRP
jgi:hypothetical protein